MKPILISILCLILCFQGHSQNAFNSGNYGNFLIDNSDGCTPLANFRLQYLYMPSSQPFRSGGTSVQVGLNLSRFLTKKFLLGITYNRRIFATGYVPQHFSQSFRDDFNASFNTVYDNKTDSLRGQVLSECINGTSNSYVHNMRSYYWGISFSPFPSKWGAFLLDIKQGWSMYVFTSDKPLTLLHAPYPEDGKSVSFSASKLLAAELTFKPYFFHNSGFTPLSEITRFADMYQFLTVSLFYQQFGLKNAYFSGKELNTLVHQPFIDKYSGQHYIGVKLGLGIY